MPIDRAATLRNAEKLLRQGKLERGHRGVPPRRRGSAARLEHREHARRSLRARRPDRQGGRAVHPHRRQPERRRVPAEGRARSTRRSSSSSPTTSTRCCRRPRSPRSQGLLRRRARRTSTRVAERRRARGDARGVAQADDPARHRSTPPTSTARMTAAQRARRDRRLAGAVRDLKEIAAELAEKGRQPEAIEALREAALISPTTRRSASSCWTSTSPPATSTRARECASTAEQFKSLAAALEAARPGGRGAGRRCARRRASTRRTPSCARTWRGRSWRAATCRRPREYLTAETAGDDPQLLLTVGRDPAARRQRRRGHGDRAAAARTRIPRAATRSRRSAGSVAEQAPEAGVQGRRARRRDARSRRRTGPSAAAALQEFVTRVPNHIPALMRLVEICVDGGLEATMYSAQAQLADAYIAAGRRPRRGSSPRISSRASRGSAPTSSGSAARWCCSGEPDPDGADRRAAERPVAVHEHRS